MKRILSTLIPCGGLLLPLFAPAQGTLYVSNLTEPSAGSRAVASDEWLAATLHTGSNSGGYILNSVQLLVDAASGTPAGFSVSLFNSDGANPGSSLGSLSGSTDPSSAGVFTYTASGLELSAATEYWIVVAATTSLSSGAYHWCSAPTAGFDSTDDWGLFAGKLSSNDGLGWDVSRNIFQFAVYATVVPEPPPFVLTGLGLAALTFWRLRPNHGNRHIRLP